MDQAERFSPSGKRPGRSARRFGSLALVALVAMAASGCTSPREWIRNGFKVGPNYCPPCADVAEQYIAAADPRVSNRSADDSRWWAAFHDPRLDNLIQIAYEQNLSLREACFRILEARMQRAIAVGNFFPQTQQAFADYSRSAVSTTVANHQAIQQAIQQPFYSLWDGGFNLAWELDFWGRFRRAIESADAQVQVTVEDYDAALVLLVSSVADTYARVRTLQEQLRLTEANVALQRKTFDIVQTQRKLGKSNQLAVEQAATSLGQTEALIPPLRIQIRQAINQLCVLLGTPPEKLEEQTLLGVGPIPTAAAEVAVGIPADLLRRRPDVRRAERQLAVQSARIGIATAQLYPQISIAGTIGVQSRQLATLPDSESFIGSIGPSLRWDVLNYGRNLSAIRLQDAKFQQLVAAYQNTVLTANEEAENGLVAFLESQLQVGAQRRAATAARNALDLGLVQFQEGIIDFNTVFVLEQTLVQQENQLAQARGNVATGLISIYKALGGGWQIRLADGAAPALDAEPARPAEVIEPPLPPEPTVKPRGAVPPPRP